MDYALAIRRNRDQIKDIVLALFVLAKMRVGGSLFALPRSTFSMVMLVLRPAESAVRRLILIAAYGLKPSTAACKEWRGLPSPVRGGVGGGGAQGANGAGHVPAFKLFDPLKHFDPEAIWDAEPVWESGFNLGPNYSSTPALEDKTLGATHIGQRLNALIRALDNLPAQARRLIRWQAKRDAALKAHRPTRVSPMRPGLPPGWRQRRVHEIDDVLRECQGLANDRLNSPNTS